jgi:Ni/Co efflux regulator RcnB
MLKKFAVALVAASMLSAPVLLAGASKAAPATTQTITVPATKASVKTVKAHRKHVRHAKRHTAKVVRHGKVHTARTARHGKAVKHARKMVRQPVTQGAKTSKPAA